MRVCKMDETDYWTEEMQRECGKIYGVYLYDETEYTYCCSLTPAYCLWFVEYQTEEITDRARECLWEWPNEQVVYVNVRDIDKLPVIVEGELRQGTMEFECEEREEEQSQEEWMWGAVEEFGANPV